MLPMRRRYTVLGLLVAAAVALTFLIPVVYYAQPTGVYHCPANGCWFPHFGSLTYWAFGVGGIWTYGCTGGVVGVCVSGSEYVIVG